MDTTPLQITMLLTGSITRDTITNAHGCCLVDHVNAGTNLHIRPYRRMHCKKPPTFGATTVPLGWNTASHHLRCIPSLPVEVILERGGLCPSARTDLIQDGLVKLIGDVPTMGHFPSVSHDAVCPDAQPVFS